MVSSDDEGTKMTAKSSNPKKLAEQMAQDIRQATHRHLSAEDKMRIVLDGLLGEDTLPSCAARKALPSAYITPGPRSSWRPASVAWPAIRRAANSNEVTYLSDTSGGIRRAAAGT